MKRCAVRCAVLLLSLGLAAGCGVSEDVPADTPAEAEAALVEEPSCEMWCVLDFSDCVGRARGAVDICLCSNNFGMCMAGCGHGAGDPQFCPLE